MSAKHYIEISYGFQKRARVLEMLLEVAHASPRKWTSFQPRMTIAQEAIEPKIPGYEILGLLSHTTKLHRQELPTSHEVTKLR